MSELINGKRMEQIRNALCVCTNGGCSKYKCAYEEDGDCSGSVMRDALELIKHLESERDAAIEDLKAISHCCTCSNRDPGEDGVCKNSGGGGAPFMQCLGYVWDKKLPEPPEEGE